MCYTVIPGTDNTIRAIHLSPRPNRSAPPTMRVLPRRTDDVSITSGEREPMRHSGAHWGYTRWEIRTSHERGKRLAKRQHKPDWFDNYVKF